MWVTLPPRAVDASALHRAAAERGVAFVKGTDFMLEGGENSLRLAYSGVTPEQIDEGVARLAAAYRSL
jgi:DNA-binding transcriptional MocR family regulator